MLSEKHRPARNLINLTDTEQVRVLTKRLKISLDDLARIVEKSGNSIAAISKEVELQRKAAQVIEVTPTHGSP